MNPLGVDCGYCDARPGEPCLTRTGRRVVPHVVRVRTARRQRTSTPPLDPDQQVGALLVALAGRFAAAWANGDELLANRWARTAFVIRGDGEYVDPAPADEEHGR